MSIAIPMPDVDMDMDLITTTIPEFRRLSGISRSRIYEMLETGELESIHVGTRRLILIDSYRRLIEAQRGATTCTGAKAAIAGKS